MDYSYFMKVSKEALLLALMITAPPVLLALVVGLTISILQATTQIQEQTLTFVPKLVVVIMSLILMSEFMSGQLMTFTHNLFSGFARFVH